MFFRLPAVYFGVLGVEIFLQFLLKPQLSVLLLQCCTSLSPDLKADVVLLGGSISEQVDAWKYGLISRYEDQGGNLTVNMVKVIVTIMLTCRMEFMQLLYTLLVVYF